VPLQTPHRRDAYTHAASPLSFPLPSLADRPLLSARQLGSVAFESQDYRTVIRHAILSADADARIVDPLEMMEGRCSALHAPGTLPEDMWQEDSVVRQAFGEVVESAAQSDVVVSFLPRCTWSVCGVRERN